MNIHYNCKFDNDMSGLINVPCLYSTVRVSLLEKDSDEVSEALYDFAAQYCYDAAFAMAQFKNDKYSSNDFMQYFELTDNKQMESLIKQKVKTARLSTQAIGETLFAVLRLNMVEDLTIEEMEVFANQIEHQYKDGWGADFEMQNILASSLDVIALRLWHDDLTFYTGEAFESRFNTQAMQIPQTIEKIRGGNRMGSWGITAFESDTGLDAVDYIRSLSKEGKLELGKIIHALQKDKEWIPDVQNAESHTSAMALAEIIIMYLDHDFSRLDYEQLAQNNKFANINSFTASKEPLQWLRNYLSDTLKYARENAKEHGPKWNGWFEEENWIGWQKHILTLVNRLDSLLSLPDRTIELASSHEQEQGLKLE